MLDLTREVLGTHIRIVTPTDTPHAAELIEAAFAEVQRIEQAYSRFLPDTALSELNAHIHTWHTVSPELFELLTYGKQLEDATQGAFSLSVKSILEGWGYDAAYTLGHESTPGATGAYLLNPDTHAVYLTASVELGGLGKGYALDRMRTILSPLQNFFINAGGDIYGQGTQAAHTPWMAYLEHPADPTRVIGEVAVEGFFLASSSPLRRHWRDRHHLVHPATRLPATDMATTFVQASTGIAADSLSTALFVIGYSAARTYVDIHGIAAVLVAPTGDMYISPNFCGVLYRA